MKMTVKLFLLIVLLSVESFAIDFTTIGQKEIVDYIKNRADILYGAKLSERNLQDLLSSAVFTGLEEEALTFAYGKSVGSEPVPDVELNPKNLLSGLTALVSDSTTDSVPLKIFLTSDSQGTTDIQMGALTTTKSSSSKQSVGDFVVTSVQSDNNDVTNLDGSITINLGGSTDSHNLTLIKTVYISAEIKISSLGSEWNQYLLENDSKLISLLPSTIGSLYTVEYQSLIRESIPSSDGALFGGVKTNGIVLIHKNPNGVLSLAGRLISGKIDPTLEDHADELVDTFLTLNGEKSRQFFIKDDGMITKKSNLLSDPNKKKLTPAKSNLISGGSALFNFLGSLYRPHKSHRKEKERDQSNYGYRWNLDSRRWHEKPREDPYSWYPSDNSGWGYNWQYDYEYRYEWNWKKSETKYNNPHESKKPSKQQVKSTTQAPSPSTASTAKPKPKPEPKVVVTTTPKPSSLPSTSPLITTTQPEKVTKPVPEPEKLTIAPTTETHVEKDEVTTTAKPSFFELSEPELPPLPKGTTVSVWTARIIQ